MSFLEDLNPVQQEAAKTTNGPVMIIAGAGSGKTRVLTYRIAHLIECGVPPYEILALTFTNKAANEMKERIRALAGEKAGRLWMGTFHSMFARVLRRECEALGYTRSFTIYDSDDSLNAIKNCMAQAGVSSQQVSPQLLRSLISGAKNQLLTPRGYAEQARDYTEEKAAEVFRLYDRVLERSNAMDFDDLLLKPIQLFTRFPNILAKYQHQFKFILVDEFQDTNRAQYQVTKLLTEKFGNICVVGDDAQSIYAFRGADIRNILDFAKDFPECKTFRLEQNYRSTRSILGVADRLIRNNLDQLKKNLWTENPEGSAVSVVECVDDRDEGYTIIQAIQEETTREKHNLKDFAVLYRTNAQSRSLEDQLRRAGIPYVIVGGIRFYERKEIKDVLAYLRLLVNPRDNESFLRSINTPTRGIGDTTIEKVKAFASRHDRSLFETLSDISRIEGLADRAKRNLSDFRDFVGKYAQLKKEMSLSEVVRSLVDEIGILRIFKEEGTAESMARWENVQELLSAISDFHDTRKEGTLEEFLEEVALVSDMDTWEGTKKAVTLMTLHSSKGLEFPVVFIAGLEEGLLPFYTNSIDRPDLEEERRLFYVGITRAKQKLVLTHARMRYRFGEPAIPSPSRFLSEIGTENIEFLGSKTAVRGTESRRRAVSIRGRTRTKTERGMGVEEQYFSDPLPDYESESQEVVEVKRGSVVHHETFGRGRVIEVQGNGDSRKAVVQFDEYGVKNLILKFARLRPA